MTRPVPPKTIRVGPFPFTVEFRHDHTNAGELDSNGQRIHVAHGMALQQEQDTVLHEVLHACAYLVGLSARWATEHEEEFIRCVTGPLLDVLKRNPKLTEYLLSNG